MYETSAKQQQQQRTDEQTVQKSEEKKSVSLLRVGREGQFTVCFLMLSNEICHVKSCPGMSNTKINVKVNLWLCHIYHTRETLIQIFC